MNSLRKWFYRPRKDDPSLMAQFYYADDELNMVAAELDSFDGRKDPERCTALVNQLRQCQDRVLNICIEMMDEVIPHERASRDFRVKFPDDVMQENLAGQLWFGAECLAAGSSILNREAESSRMRPLAKAVTKTIEIVRNLLREQCLKPVQEYTEKIRESLKIFDRLFAEFELSYVSAMVKVKSVEEHDVQQNVVVLFSETVQRALRLGLTTQEQIDDYDPALMFTIPRLAIVAGLVMFPDGPLNLDREPRSLSELFRPFRTLLSKIRELLWTMSSSELAALEKALCSMDEPDPSSSHILTDESLPLNAYGHATFTSEFVQKFYASYPSCKYLTPELSSLYQPGKKPERYERKRERTSGKSRGSRSRARQERQNDKFLARLNATVEERPRARRRSRRSHYHRHHQNPPPPPPADSDSGEEHHRPQHHHTRVSPSHSEHQQHDHIPPPPPPPPYDSQHHQRLQGHQSDQHHQHVRQHSQRSRRSRRQPVDRIKIIACSCGTVSEYDHDYYDESHQGPYQPDTRYDASQAHCKRAPIQSHIAHSHCSTASNNCDNLCDSTTVTVQAESRWGEAGPSYVRDCASNVVGEGGAPTLVSASESQETENRDTSLSNATAQLSVLDDSMYSKLSCCEMCGSAQPCSCENQDFALDGSADPYVADMTSNEYGEKFSEMEKNEAGSALGMPGLAKSKELEVVSCTQESDQRNGQIPAQTSFTVSADPVSPESHSGRCSSGSTSPYNSGAEDDEEVALALQAAEVAATWRARARFSDAQDLIHRLFVCISGVADQLQTNYASDLRKILKCVFLMNQSPPEEPPKSQDNEEPEWSAASPLHSYEDGIAENSIGGNDSERLSVESAEDALVVIGSPEHHCSSSMANAENEPQDDSPPSSPHSSPPSSPPSSPSAVTSSMSFPALALPQTSTPPSSIGLSSRLVQSPHTSPRDIPLSSTNTIPTSSPPPACPPSIQVPAAIFNDHALMQFSEVTQASIPPNVELLPPLQVQYAESFGVIPEPFSRSSQEQSLGSRDGVELASPGSPMERSSESGRRRHRVQEPPAWVPDQQAPRCMSCGAAFTMVRRRHHCRNCGKVFCAHCSQHAVPLPHFGIWKAVRVCNVCFLYYVTFSTETTTPTS